MGSCPVPIPLFPAPRCRSFPKSCTCMQVNAPTHIEPNPPQCSDMAALDFSHAKHYFCIRMLEVIITATIHAHIMGKHMNSVQPITSVWHAGQGCALWRRTVRPCAGAARHPQRGRHHRRGRSAAARSICAASCPSLPPCLPLPCVRRRHMDQTPMSLPILAKQQEGAVSAPQALSTCTYGAYISKDLGGRRYMA